MISKNKSNAGRPKAELDEKQIIELAKIQCTMGEIAAVMGCSVDTLERNFAEIIESGRACGRESLRRAQWKLGMSGNCSMLIWLGRFVLQQREEININAGSETEVKKLLESWEISAKKKTTFDRARDQREQKIVEIGA